MCHRRMNICCVKIDRGLKFLPQHESLPPQAEFKKIATVPLRITRKHEQLIDIGACEAQPKCDVC